VSAELLLISSYPKSGNTWTRLVFEYLLNRGQKEVSINELNGAFHGWGRRTMFDIYAPAGSSDLTFDEIENLLPELFRSLAASQNGKLVVKVHDCSHRTSRGEWLFPPEHVSAAVCLVRHPFDVAVSYANHMGQPVAAAIETMSAAGSPGQRELDRLEIALPLWLGSWSDNIESWLLRSPYPTVVARYEDLHQRPEEEFLRLVAGAGVPVTPELIRKAVEATRFDRLQEQERETGFRERPKASGGFFRSGRPNSWEGLLDEEARAQIVREHGAMMDYLGYRADGSIAPTPAALLRT
jgi:hypothetical protein